MHPNANNLLQVDEEEFLARLPRAERDATKRLRRHVVALVAGYFTQYDLNITHPQELQAILVQVCFLQSVRTTPRTPLTLSSATDEQQAQVSALVAHRRGSQVQSSESPLSLALCLRQLAVVRVVVVYFDTARPSALIANMRELLLEQRWSPVRGLLLLHLGGEQERELAHARRRERY